MTVAGDVTEYDDCQRVADAAMDAFGRIDVLVNNAGWADDRLIRTEHVEPDDLREDGEDRPRRAVLHDPGVRARTCCAAAAGSIINLSSIFGMAGSENRTAGYFAAKGGVNQLTRLLACEWGDRNLRVNALAPNFFMSEMTRRLLEDSGMADWMRARTPMRRLGELRGAGRAVPVPRLRRVQLRHRARAHRRRRVERERRLRPAPAAVGRVGRRAEHTDHARDSAEEGTR